MAKMSIFPPLDLIQAILNSVLNTVLFKVQQVTTNPSSSGRTDFQTYLCKYLSQVISVRVRRKKKYMKDRQRTWRYAKLRGNVMPKITRVVCKVRLIRLLTIVSI